MAADADAALAMIAERAGDSSGSSGIVSNQYCSDLMIAALAEGNGELAFSILEAMRSSVIQRRVNDREEGMHMYVCVLYLPALTSGCFADSTKV